MIHQIQQAVGIANSSTADLVLKKQALEYIGQAKSSDNAAHLFSSLLQDSNSDDLCKFVALQVLSDLVSESNKDQLFFTKTAIIEFLRGKVSQDARDPEYVRNKIAELVSRLFYYMYGEVNGNLWSTYFQDLIQLFGLGPLQNGVSSEYSVLSLDYFLRISLAINSEIADQTFVRSKEIQVKNNCLKDTMRLQDVQLLTSLWFHVLKTVQQQQQQYELAGLTLSCIGSYISWVDVNLIVNSEYIGLIYHYLDFPQSKVSCSQCLCEIISKKMKPGDKLALLGMLNLTDKVVSIGDDDIEVHEQLAKLASSVGVELSIILEQCNEGNASSETQAIASAADQQILRQVSPLVLKFMAHEYDSVTQQCFNFLSQYLAFLKKLFAIGGKPGSAVAMNSKRLPLDQEHLEFLNLLIAVCMKKMKIDETCDEDSIDEIDEFNETIRSKLKVFQDSIAIINPSIYMDNMSKHIETLMASTDWRDLELATYQMHNFAESVKNNLFGLNKNEITNSQPHIFMSKCMATLLSSTVLFQINNPLIQISFFELVVRHYSFLDSTNKDEVTLLNVFCSEFGMFNNRERVRLRTWYLFTRFIKSTKPKMVTGVLSQLLSKITPLLIVKTVPPVSNSPDIDTTFDNQLYLFEGVGTLIGANADLNYEILDNILTPLFSDLETCISSQVKSPEIVLQTHHVLMAIGTIARGVHAGLVPENQVNNPQVSTKLIHRSLIEKFSNIAEVILVTFSYFNKYETIRDAARFSFARLTPILNNEIIPFASRLISIFLNSELKALEMNDFLGFLGQIVHMFHTDDNCYQLLNNLLTPVIKKVFDLIIQMDQESTVETSSGSAATSAKVSNGKNVVVTDSFRDKVMLKKAYYSFLQSFITNNVTSLLLTETNRNVLPLVLTDLLTYTPEEINETSSMKLSMNVLVSFIKFFGTGICTDPKDRNANNFNKLDGLNEFFISKAIPLVFEIPFKPDYGFNINDGSCRVVACDLSRLLKAVCIINGDINDNACLKYLADVYFPQVQFPSQLSMEFVQALATYNEKSFEKYFVNFITNMKS